MQTLHEPHPPLRLYTVADAAEALGVSQSYLYEQIREGRISTVELGTDKKSKLRIRASELEAFIEARTTPATAGAESTAA